MMDKSLKNNTDIIKCLFLPVGLTNIKTNKPLSNFLKTEYGIENKIENGFLFNEELIILGSQEQLNLCTSNLKLKNTETKKMFPHKDVDLINFLADNLYYGVIRKEKNNKKTVVGKLPFKKTSYYKIYFFWIPIENKNLNPLIH